jgi:hypothetical protein
MAKRKQTWERAARKRKSLRIRKAAARQVSTSAATRTKKSPSRTSAD